MQETETITLYQKKLENILLHYNIAHLSNTQPDEILVYLREDYTFEDFVFEYSHAYQDYQYDILVTFLAYKTYLKIAKMLKTKPSSTEQKFIASVYSSVESDFLTINKINGYLSQTPELVVRDVVNKLNRDVISKWYESFSVIKDKKVDPKGLNRIKRLNDNYIEIIEKDRNNILGKGRLSNNQAYLIILSPKRNEMLAIYLYDCRGVIGKSLIDGKDTIVVLDKRGSVTGTTLKEVKASVKEFASQAQDKLFWKAVSDFVNENL